MAAQARISLFPWAVNRVAILRSSPPPMPAMWSNLPSGGRYEPALPKERGGLVGWRMIGGNNREVGRCPHPSESAAEAYRVVHAAQLAVRQQEARMLCDAVAGWFWHISLDGEWLAVSSRGYQRQRECVFSLEQFLEFFPTARVVMPPAPRSRATRSGSLTVLTVPGVVGPMTGVAGQTDQVTT